MTHTSSHVCVCVCKFVVYVHMSALVCACLCLCMLVYLGSEVRYLCSPLELKFALSVCFYRALVGFSAIFLFSFYLLRERERRDGETKNRVISPLSLINIIFFLLFSFIVSLVHIHMYIYHSLNCLLNLQILTFLQAYFDNLEL